MMDLRKGETMKKFSFISIGIIIAISTFLLGFNFNTTKEPNSYYQVYLDNEILGTVTSKKELEDYINKKGDSIKQKYQVENVYAPNGLQIKKINTFNNKLSKIEDIYSKIEEKSPFTIHGYVFNIKKENETIKVYVTSPDIFKDAVMEMIYTFVGKNSYQAYLDGTQLKIVSTGKEITNVYLEDDITYKETYIPVSETIYTTSQQLAKYLLFGTTEEQRKYIVQAGDTIESVAFQNEISVEEFLISNPTFTSEKNLLFPGQEVTIGVTDAKINVVEESYVVQDIESNYKVEEVYDDSLVVGTEVVRRAGENGLERVSQEVKRINGSITFINPISNETLKPAVNKIIALGTRQVPSIGRTGDWTWPTDSGWTISSPYGWRIDPFSGERSFHAGLDIAGTGYGSPIYAVTNGVVTDVNYGSVNGYYVTIDHNNGYWTRYLHQNSWPIVSVGQVVAQGQVIGYVGSTGAATGPHLHLEVWVGQPYRGGYTVSPFSMY